jgi:hypothetical protein
MSPKPYFAISLPVKEEITEGNYWLHLNAKKIKLFLCSRDIKVGDKAYSDVLKDNIERIVVPSIQEALELGSIPTLTVGAEGYKIIGEISPDAKWVKEGDEFDENEIKIVIKSKFSHRESYFDTEYNEDSEREVFKSLQLAEIKGPCGHFH